MMQVSKKIPFEDPQVLTLVRGAYILSNVIIAAVYFYVQTKINAKKGKPRFCKAFRDIYTDLFSQT